MAAIRRRRCERCGQLFNPDKPSYRRCRYCFSDTADVGFASSRQSRGRPDRTYGGVSRRHDRRRALLLQGDDGRARVLHGYQQLATDVYGRRSGLSTFLEKAGMPRERYLQLQNTRLMDNYLLKLCPEFRDWLFHNLGDKGMELVIDAYGLYGDPRLTLKELEYNLNLDDARRCLGWSISRIRRELKAVETLFYNVAAQLV